MRFQIIAFCFYLHFTHQPNFCEGYGCRYFPPLPCSKRFYFILAVVHFCTLHAGLADLHLKYWNRGEMLFHLLKYSELLFFSLQLIYLTAKSRDLNVIYDAP